MLEPLGGIEWGVWRSGEGQSQAFKGTRFGGRLILSFSSDPLFSVRTECPPILCKPVGSEKELEAIQLLCLP